MKTIPLVLLFIALVSLPAGAQPATGVLAGRLLGVDSLGVEFPLGARRVSFRGGDSLIATRTDTAGRFVLTVPAGERTVRYHGWDGVVEEGVFVPHDDTAHVTLRVRLGGHMRGFVLGREDPNRMEGWETPGQLERVAYALEWSPGRMPDDHRELWIWASYALFGSDRFTRLVVDGGVVRGEVVQYWPLDPYSPWLDYRLRRLETVDQCDTVVVAANDRRRSSLAAGERYCQSHADQGCREPEEVGLFVCRLRLDEQPDWNAVLGELERQNVWALPDESGLPSAPWVTVDGWGMLVRVHKDRDVRWYAYSNPEEGLSVHHARARAIAETLQAVGGVQAPTDGD